MAVRFAFVFLAAIVIFQMITWSTDATVIRRDTATTQNSSQTIDEALQSFKTGLDDLIKNIQSNEVYRNVSQSLKDFGETVQNQGKQLVDKLQTATKTTN